MKGTQSTMSLNSGFRSTNAATYEQAGTTRRLAARASLRAWRTLGSGEVRPGISLGVNPWASVMVSLQFAGVATALATAVGAAAALASGMAWVAHGSDLGGSLRNPASFCGVVGMRPSPGRVAASVYGKIDGTLGVEGPMARTVEDLALLFDAMVGLLADTSPASTPALSAGELGIGLTTCSRPVETFTSTITPIPPTIRAIDEMTTSARKVAWLTFASTDSRGASWLRGPRRRPRPPDGREF